MFNLLLIVGNLGGDPEMRFTPQGTPVTNFSVASNRSYNKADGQKVTETEWFNAQAWNKQAEVCNQYLKKGSLVLVAGRVKTETWTAEGQTKSKKVLVAEKVIFLNTAKKDAAEQIDMGAPAQAEPEGELPF